MEERKLSYWGWGYQDQALDETACRNLASAAASRLGSRVDTPAPVTPLDQVSMDDPRIEPPGSFADFVYSDRYMRATHTYGKSFTDVVRGLSGDYSNAPDLVAMPRNETEVVDVLEWVTERSIAVIPFGGGTSVVGGVEPRLPDGYGPSVSLDMKLLNKVVEIDRVSRAARIQAGALGPAIEEQLRPEGYTLRHFPQSFEFSTLGGWIATRSGGHYATLYTHIDDFVESLRVVSPSGTLESRRLPGSGAGPSPDRIFIGSEGVLGVITEAWMRIQDRPTMRAGSDVRFGDFESAVEAVREISQAGLFPTNCRLLDPIEAMTAGGSGEESILIVGFESADHPPAEQMARALEICRSHGGVHSEDAGIVKTDATATRTGAAGAWRTSFINAPYVRDALIRMGLVVETFETSVTWDRFDRFHAEVMENVRERAESVCGSAWVSCRFTHVYPDGPAPYYTVVGAAGTDVPVTERFASQISRWRDIKAAASETIIESGGSITHHHAVGRDHRRWYDLQRPDQFAEVLRAAKSVLDPRGILNPGVLIDPQ